MLVKALGEAILMFENTALEAVWQVYLAGIIGFTGLGISFYRNCIMEDQEELEKERKKVKNLREEKKISGIKRKSQIDY
jgi:hypothetical protein